MLVGDCIPSATRSNCNDGSLIDGSPCEKAKGFSMLK